LNSGLELSLAASGSLVAQRHRGCSLAAQPVLMCVVPGTAGAAQAALVLPRLARPSPWRRPRIQPKVAEDLLDHRPLEDGRDDLELPVATVRAALHVDVESEASAKTDLYSSYVAAKTRLSSRAQLIRCGRS